MVKNEGVPRLFTLHPRLALGLCALLLAESLPLVREVDRVHTTHELVGRRVAAGKRVALPDNEFQQLIAE